VIEMFRSAEHSRLLVVDGDPDSVVGVIYARICSQAPGRKSARPTGIPDPPGRVRPGRQDAGSPAARLSAERDHLVVVVDEFGGTSGIVTLEIPSRSSGIRDEYDIDEWRRSAPA
jgi:CBS domain containing-hemolysin-like protein